MNSRNNIISNHDFSRGLRYWQLIGCDGLVRSAESGYPEGISPKSGYNYAAVTNRKKNWHGLQQDITAKICKDPTYTVSAWVGVSHGFARVQAMLKFQYTDLLPKYFSLGSTSVCKGKWRMLEGTFSLSCLPMPQRLIFYLHGPAPGLDLLVDSADITLSTPGQGQKRITYEVEKIMQISSSSSSASSLPSSSTISDSKYDVFLTFRGADTRHNFTDDLYKALTKKGIKTFKDDTDLERGEEIEKELLKAIEISKFSIVIFSQNYASSKWCLNELVKILECLESEKIHKVLPVFFYVNPTDVRNYRGKFRELDANHIKDNEERTKMINKWKDALTKAGNLSGWHLQEEPDSQRFKRSYEREYIDKICAEIIRVKEESSLNVP